MKCCRGAEGRFGALESSSERGLGEQQTAVSGLEARLWSAKSHGAWLASALEAEQCAGGGERRARRASRQLNTSIN